ncbi:MAG: ATP-binding protein [Actinomycetota bacterium]|nr:ATP-binding protein [Actinomycetota bacterium]MDA2972017.1 ATP-binding protein [Actinomycetota bacterium]MDA3000435.1 ATP-binding protein [Actinomycetota bacterium]
MTVLLVVIASVIGVAAGIVVERRRKESGTSMVADASVVDSDDVLLEQAIDALGIGVVVASADGEIVFENAIAGGPTGALHSDVLVEEAIEIHVRAALEGQTRRQTIELFGPPRRVVSVSAVPLADGGAVAIVEDVTERSRLDAVRTDFVANISHELKTPVGALSVLAEALVDEDQPEVVQRLADKMVREAIRAGRTIDDLLELSRIELGGEAVKDVVLGSMVVDESVSRARSLAERAGIELHVEPSSDRIRMLGDRRQLVSALGNLVENAVKYSDPDSRVEVSARSDGRWVELSVRDFGVGIPQKDLDRIFERFYRVDRARSRETGGTGLGLAIVRHVATNHGGDVQVTSVEGEGSTFTLRVPAAPGLVSASMRDAG